MPAERDPAIETLINDGRQAYSFKRYKNALECFTRAMKRCVCARGTRRERCRCKNYERVASENGSIFNEAMYTCKCPVRETFRKCDSSLHVQALDYRAATFEALKEFDRARKDAEWILELSPRVPDGYLRLGKVLRLQKKHEFAWKVYSAGIEAAVSNNCPKSDPKVEMLYGARKPLHARFGRYDPLQLPLDIVHFIFDYVDFWSRLRCLRVCRAWRKSLTGPENRHLWRTLDFTGTILRFNPPTIAALSKLVGYSGNDARRLVIQDSVWFRLTSSKLRALLRGAPNLEYLELHREFETFTIQPQLWPRRLTHLVLGDMHPPPGLLQAISNSLTHLHITTRPSKVETEMELPFLPNLRYFRLSSKHRCVHLNQLARLMPSLEQLWLPNTLPPTSEQIEGEAKEDIAKAWRQLKVVIVEDTAGHLSHADVMNTIRLVSINQGTTLQYLEIPMEYEDTKGGTILGQNTDWNGMYRLVGHGETGSGQPNTFANLKCLRLPKGMCLDAAALQPTLRTPLDSGNLQSIDINFRRPRLNEPAGPSSCQRVKDFGWLRGAGSIRSIGIFNFRFQQFPMSDDDLPLPSFLASFPNLETLEATSEYYSDGELCTVIHDIIKKETGIKTVYTKVEGVNLYQLQARARESGVSIVWGERPREWPVPIEE